MVPSGGHAGHEYKLLDTGQQALERALVDRTGSLREAVQQAAALGKLAADAPVRWIEREPGRLQQLVARFEARVLEGAVRLLGQGLGADLARGWATLFAADPVAALALSAPGETLAAGAVLGAGPGGEPGALGWLAEALQRRGPSAAFAHCLCRVEP